MSQADEDESLPSHDEVERWLSALAAALRPVELEAAVNARLIALALEDPLAPPTEQEVVESARLRDGLEGRAPHEDAATLAALRAAFDSPSEAPNVEPALAAALARPAVVRRRSSVVYAAFGGGSALLAAAAVLLLFLGHASREAPSPIATGEAFARSRSTAPLFTERFETQATTARMDLIALTRARELRNNRYAAWGVGR